MKSVESSNVTHVGYENGTLSVRFKSGGEWAYHDVPPEVHAAMMAADSVGSYFHHNVKSKFKGVKK